MEGISLFIKEHNLIRATISLAVSSIAYELLHSLGTHIIIPLLDFNKNSKPDMDEIKNLEMKILNKDIKIGLFLHTLIKFISIITILYILSKYTKE